MKLILLIATYLLASACIRAEEASDALIAKIIHHLKIAEQFDADIKGLSSSVTADTQDGRIQIWLADVRVREMGWHKVRESYIRHLKAQFTESELQQLATRLDDPLIGKLFAAHLESFKSLADLRAQLFQSYWERYNNMEFTPPEEVITGQK